MDGMATMCCTHYGAWVLSGKFRDQVIDERNKLRETVSMLGWMLGAALKVGELSSVADN